MAELRRPSRGRSSPVERTPDLELSAIGLSLRPALFCQLRAYTEFAQSGRSMAPSTTCGPSSVDLLQMGPRVSNETCTSVSRRASLGR